MLLPPPLAPVPTFPSGNALPPAPPPKPALVLLLLLLLLLLALLRPAGPAERLAKTGVCRDAGLF
jgi:hypothetical protein